MKLSVSQIAWDPDENEAVAALLNEMHVEHVDIAPSKLFPSIAEAGESDAKRIRDWWLERNLSIVGMQSLLFGTTGLSIFGSKLVQQKTLDHLRHVFMLAANLGCQALTFGSPKQRDPGMLSQADAWQIARQFFWRAGEEAKKAGVRLCIEANPTSTGCRFLTQTSEAAEMVTDVNHQAVWLQLDLGTCSSNEEELAPLLACYGQRVGHVHLSEPGLVPLTSENASHPAYSAALRQHLGQAVYTVEMLTPRGPKRLGLLRAALENAYALYDDRPFIAHKKE